MRKTPRVFQWDAEKKITREVTPGCEWVLAGEGVATRKWDGTACAVIGGKLYARLDTKRGAPIPGGAIHCGDTTERGASIYWVPAVAPEHKYHREAWEARGDRGDMHDGTCELIGPTVNANKERVSAHFFRYHGDTILNDAPRDFDSLKEYLSRLDAEGIVFHHPDGRMAKLRRSDFGFPWPVSR